MRFDKCMFPVAAAVAVLFTGSALRAQDNPVVEMKTSMGMIKIELFQDKAPITVKNFLTYADEKHYDSTIFHRVIDGFMIQGGGFTEDRKEKKTHASIKNEAGNGLKNDRSTIAMARTGEVDSATAQFFINHKNNDALNHRDNTQRGFGYAVFGKVIDGMDVVDKIAKVECKLNELGEKATPVKNVVIQSVRRVEKKSDSK